MKRTIAVATTLFGILAIVLAGESYIHLRSLAFATPPVDLSQYLDFRILTLGLIDNLSSNVIDASAFAQHLLHRIYAIGGLGLALTLIGGSLLVFPRKSKHNPTGGTSLPETNLVTG